MYNYSRFVYNPATAGMKQVPTESDGLNLTLLGRQQWLGIDGGPRMSALSVQSALSDDLRSGLGASVILDELGPLSSVGVDVSYAFYLPIGTNGAQLNFGVSGGFRQKSLNGNWIYDRDLNGDDPAIIDAPTSDIVPSLGAGIYFSGPDNRYYFGISGQDLLEPSIEGLLSQQTIGDDSKVARSFFVMGGYRFDLPNEMSLEPTVLARTEGLFPPQVDVNVYWRYKPLTIGAGYRAFNDSFSGMLGFNISPNAFLGYSYDYTLSALNFAGDVSTHELILSYTFPSAKKNPGRKTDIFDNPDKL
jgi:type IX secretion system PorP/SprF family membrane protein